MPSPYLTSLVATLAMLCYYFYTIISLLSPDKGSVCVCLLALFHQFHYELAVYIKTEKL